MSDSVPKQGIHDVFVQASGLPPTNVIWDKDGMPFFGPAAGTALVLTLTADVAQGVDEYIGTYDATAHAVHTAQSSGGILTITVRIIEFGNKDATDSFRAIRRKFSGPAILRALRALNLSLSAAPRILYQSTTIDNKAHSSAVFEVKLNWASSNDITAELGKPDGTDGYIQSVVPLTGTYTT
jgi:hypothetical protein